MLRKYSQKFEEHNFDIDFQFVGSPHAFSMSKDPIEINFAHLFTNHYKNNVQDININNDKIDQNSINSHFNVTHTLSNDDIDSSNNQNNLLQFLKKIKNNNGYTKNIHISSAIMTFVKNDFPLMIGITMSGLKIDNDLKTKNMSSFSSLVDNNFEGSTDIVLISPDIIYHRPEFIKNYGSCKSTEDLTRGLNFIKINCPKSNFDEFNSDIILSINSLNLSNNNNNNNNNNYNIEKSDKKDENFDTYIRVYSKQDYPDHSLLSKILKLPHDPFVQHFFNIQDQKQKSTMDMDIDNATIYQKQTQFNDTYINESLFNSFINKEWDIISKGNDPLSLDDIYIRIHNPFKTNTEPIHWKSPYYDPDIDSNDYSLSFKIRFIIYTQTTNNDNHLYYI